MYVHEAIRNSYVDVRMYVCGYIGEVFDWNLLITCFVKWSVRSIRKRELNPTLLNTIIEFSSTRFCFKTSQFLVHSYHYACASIFIVWLTLSSSVNCISWCCLFCSSALLRYFSFVHEQTAQAQYMHNIHARGEKSVCQRVETDILLLQQCKLY